MSGAVFVLIYGRLPRVASQTRVSACIPTSETLSEVQEAVPPTRQARAHGRVLALKALLAPRITEPECVKFILVCFLRRTTILRLWHCLAGLVDIARPSVS